MLVKSYAKINLSLKITGNRDDGYHFLEMINLPIDLYDTIEISRIPASMGSYVTLDDPNLSQLQENLGTRALNMMREAFGFKDNFNIKIHKEIPSGAGLGGGSSDAATIMLMLNKILRLNATKEKMDQIALALGADVPYFLNPVPAKVTGIGEEIVPIKVKKKYFCLLVKPTQSLSTADVYNLSDYCQKYRIETDKVAEGLASGDDIMVERYSGNDLLPAAEKLAPEIGEIFATMKNDGFNLASMSGSGSTLFALSTDLKKCQQEAKKFERKGYLVKVCKVLSK